MDRGSLLTFWGPYVRKLLGCMLAGSNISLNVLSSWDMYGYLKESCVSPFSSSDWCDQQGAFLIVDQLQAEAQREREAEEQREREEAAEDARRVRENILHVLEEAF